MYGDQGDVGRIVSVKIGLQIIIIKKEVCSLHAKLQIAQLALRPVLVAL